MSKTIEQLQKEYAANEQKIRQEQTKLQQEYEAGQAELSPLYADVKKLWNIKFCVEKVLQERKPLAQTKKHEQER